MVESVVVKLFKAMKKIEYHKLFCQVKNDEKRLENYKAQKIKMEKEGSINTHKRHKKSDHEKKYISIYTQTDPDLASTSSPISQNIEEIKDNSNSIKKQDCIWNMSKIKNFVKGKNSNDNSKPNTLNEILTDGNKSTVFNKRETYKV